MKTNKPKVPPLEWNDRPELKHGPVSLRFRWFTACGRYILEHVTYHCAALRPLWRVVAVERASAASVVISRNSTRHAALRAAHHHHRKEIYHAHVLRSAGVRRVRQAAGL